MEKFYSAKTLKDKPRFDKPAMSVIITPIALILYLSVIVFLFLDSSIATDLLSTDWQTEELRYVASDIAFWTTFVTGFILWFFVQISKGIQPDQEKQKVEIKQKIKIIAMELLRFVPFMFLFWIISMLSQMLFDFVPSNQEGIGEIITNYREEVIIFLMLVAPMYEEFMFRYAPSRFIRDKRVFIVVASTVFAMSHVIADPSFPISLIVYLPRAIYVSHRYAVTENIWVAIALHMMNNTLAFLI